LTDTTQDRLLGGRVTIFQPKGGYRAAIDPVLLAAAIPAKPTDRVLDAGSGTGAASLALAARVDGARVTGLEAQADLVALAHRSAQESGLTDRVNFYQGNLLRPPDGLKPGAFDHVMANPPYLPAGHGNPPPDPAKREATVESAAVLEDWLGFLSVMVADGGTITVVHRFDRADGVVAGLRKCAGDLVVFPLWQKHQNGEAKRVIVQARQVRQANKGGAKDGIRETRTVSGLVLHQSGGGFTPEAKAVLRDAVALDLS
jgi:tRNA1(Val) A37 N6-methylase TrmN6